MADNWLASAPVRTYDVPYRPQRPAVTWLLQREIVRYLKNWHFTVAGQILAALLFVFVFGLAIGSRITGIAGVPYKQFILPGLVVLAVVNAGYIQGNASLFEARKDRFINAVLASPLRWWEINLALTLGSIVRGTLISTGFLVIAIPLTGSHIERPGLFVASAAAVLVMAAQTGMLAGMYAKTTEHIAAIQVLTVQPLCFLGGVFYSVHDLPPVWRTVSYLNPVFYAVQAMRNAMVGNADIPAPEALVVVSVAALALTAWMAAKFWSGSKLKP